MNDDDHRYGALRESYDFEYAVMEQADKNKNTHFEFETYDTYEWYLDLGPLSNINDKYLHGSIPYWNSSVEHPDYDEFWKKEAWVSQLHSSTVPNLNVAGFWDQEDPWGPWQIFRHAEENDPRAHEFHGCRPVVPRRMAKPKGDSIGLIPFGGHETAREFRENIEAPFFRYYLHGQGDKPAWQASTFQSGSNTWRTYAGMASQRGEAHESVSARGRNAFVHRASAKRRQGYREYVSDPANPVPYRQRPISPTYPAGDWRTWEVADQRFVDQRPDVLSYRQRTARSRSHHDRSAWPLDLFASTSGTDSDFVVKLIDVYPQDAQKNAWNPDEGPKPGQYAQSLNGYELPIAMEVRRGRYLASYEQPACLDAEQADGVGDPAARPRSRLPQRPPNHGADSIDMVSGDRPQPAEIRTQHLQSARPLIMFPRRSASTARSNCLRTSSCRSCRRIWRGRLAGSRVGRSCPTSSHKENRPGDYPRAVPVSIRCSAIFRPRFRAVPATTLAACPVVISNRCSC